MRAFLLAPFILAAAMSGCAPSAGGVDGATGAGPSATGACFYPNQVRNFSSGPDNQFYVRSVGDTVFELSVVGACPDLDSAVALALVPRFSGGSRLCRGDEARVVISQPTPTFPAPCYVRVERALTPEEVAALPESSRP